MSESKSASVVFTNGSLLAKNAQATASSAKSAADNAYSYAADVKRVSDGKNSNYYGKSISEAPTSSLAEGDLFFTSDTVYSWDGTSWNKIIYDTMGEDVKKQVEQAVSESKTYSDQVKSSIEAEAKQIQSDLEVSVSETNSNLSKAQTDISSVKTDLASTKTSLSSTQASLASDEATIASNTKAISDNQATVSADLKNKATQLDSLTAKAKSQGESISILETSTSGLTKSYADLSGNVSTLSAGLDGAKADIKDNKSNLASYKATADALSTSMTNAQGDITSLKTRAGSIEAALSDGKGGLVDVKTTTDGLSTTISKKVDSTTYSADKTALQNSINTKADKTALNNYVTTTTYNAYTSQTAEKLSNVYTKKEVDSKNETLNTAISKSQQTADAITNTVANLSKSDYHANKLLTSDQRNLNNWSKIGSGTTVITFNNDVNKLKFHGAGGEDGYSLTLQLEANKKYSFYFFWTNYQVLANWGTIAGSSWSVETNTNAKLQIGFDSCDKTPFELDFSSGSSGNVTITFNFYNLSDDHIYSFDISNLSLVENITENEISETKQTVEGIRDYVQKSNGSSYLATLLNQTASNASLSALVNGKVVSAINVSTSGDTLISGSKVHITGETTIDEASIKSSKIKSLSADKIDTGTLDASKVTVVKLNADNIKTGTLNGVDIKGATITGSQFVSSFSNEKIPGNDTFWTEYRVTMDSSGMTITGQYNAGTSPTTPVYTSTTARIYGNIFYQEMKNNSWNRWINISNEGENPSLELSQSWTGGGSQYTYVGSDMIWSDLVKSNTGWFGDLKTVGNKIFVLSGNTLQITNSAGQNNNSVGTVGLSIWGGLGFGKQTIYTQTNDIYCQKGDPNTGALSVSYNSAAKATVHAQKIVSQVANTVSSRLSVKTDITPVTYDRALAAVEGTEMYDYRYISDASGQHYVSGIIDDINPDPQYHMDDMLINKERTARIDSNLVGYHHVVLQKILKRLDKLEAKEK